MARAVEEGMHPEVTRCDGAWRGHKQRRRGAALAATCLLSVEDASPWSAGMHSVRLIVSAMFISHDTVFFSHNKIASAGL